MYSANFAIFHAYQVLRRHFQGVFLGKKANSRTLTRVLPVIFMLSACFGEDYSELQLASARGQTDLVEVMLSRGSDVNQANGKGKTALMMAASSGRTDTAKVLLARGAAVDAQDVDGMTALMVAASGGFTDTSKLLLQNGANINAQNKYGVTPIANAVFFGHPETVRALLAHNVRVERGAAEEAMLIAAGLGHTSIVESLLNFGVDINARGKKQRNALMAAVSFNHPATVAALLARHADLDARDDDGKTALMIAEHAGKNDIIDMLRKAAARPSKAS